MTTMRRLSAALATITVGVSGLLTLGAVPAQAKIVHTNLPAMNSHRSLNIASGSSAKATEKLASGSRINKAADDAAGLAISEKMRNQIRGLNMDLKNADDGISLIQTAEGALDETHAILQRMRELAVQAANDTYSASDRDLMQREIDQLREEVDRIGSQTEFNGIKLLDGSAVESKQGDSLISIQISDLGGMPQRLDSTLKAPDGWQAKITEIDEAIEFVSTQRANLGALQNRLENAVNNVDVAGGEPGGG